MDTMLLPSDVSVCNTTSSELLKNMEPRVTHPERFWPYDPCRNITYTGYGPYITDKVMREPSSLITYGQIYPILLIITAITNIFVVLVLSRKHMQTPTNRLLLYMALADLCVALAPLPYIIFYHLLNNHEHLENLESWWCFLALYTVDASPPFCHNVAMWLAVLVAAQRLVYIQAPHAAQAWCTIRNVNIASAVVVLVSAVCAAPYYFHITEFVTLKWRLTLIGGSTQQNLSQYQCIFRHSLFVEAVGLNLYFSLYFWTRIVFFVALPSALLTTFSCFLLRGIRLANQRHQRLLSENRSHEAKRQKENMLTSVMLVLIVVVFLIVNLPQGTILALKCISQLAPVVTPNSDDVLITMNIDNMLILATYPINFAIYCSMSMQFRKTFRELFCASHDSSFRGLRADGSHRSGMVPSTPSHCTPLLDGNFNQRSRQNSNTSNSRRNPYS